MKRTDIKVGRTYYSRGKGTSHRKVLAIGDEHRPVDWFGAGPPPNEPGVLFRQKVGKGAPRFVTSVYLKTFAAWCGGEVKEG